MARVTYPLKNGGKLVLNKKAFVELMKSGEMQRDLMRRARKVKAAAVMRCKSFFCFLVILKSPYKKTAIKCTFVLLQPD